MALRSCYKGIKKLASGLKWNRPGILAADDIALAKVFFPRSEQRVLGAKNLCPNTGTTQTINGITFTVNDDKSITMNGTATDSAAFVINARDKWLKTGVAYKLSGLNGGSSNTYKLDLTTQSGPIVATYEATDFEPVFTVNNSEPYNARIVVYNGQTVSNITVYPMVRLASDPDDTYVSYVMTNEQLTEKHKIKDVTLIAGTGVDVRPATSVKIEDKLLSGYFALKNDTENDMASNTVIGTISGITVHHGANWVLPAIITDNMTNTAVMLSHDNTNNTITIKNQTSLPAGNVLAFSFTEYLLKA